MNLARRIRCILSRPCWVGLLLAVSFAYSREARSTSSSRSGAETRRTDPKMRHQPIEVIPGKSIGDLRLGARADELPKSVSTAAGVGEMDGVTFSMADGKVDDVWIEDLRKITRGVRVAGHLIRSDISLTDLKKTLGPCHRVEGIKGGAFFNCDSGVTIGCDFREEGTSIQLRLKPR